MLGTFDRRTFINVTDGKLRQRVEPDHPQAKERKVTNPKTGDSKIVSELVYDFVEGNIIKIYAREQEGFGKQWIVEMQDGEEFFNISINYESGYAFAFLSRIFNVDISQRLRLTPYYIEDDRRAGIGIRQGGEKIKPYYTKDDPKDMPKLKNPDDESDRKIWKIQVLKFLQDKVDTKLTPILQGLYPIEYQGKEPVPAPEPDNPLVEEGKKVQQKRKSKAKAEQEKMFDDPDEMPTKKTKAKSGDEEADDLPF